ncbi:hypothetical protein Bbelb_263880 [Branchiostoma belcheri]|nr:hypothetical protein Bbelb_263880 [Branchiostoma belcheri]
MSVETGAHVNSFTRERGLDQPVRGENAMAQTHHDIPSLISTRLFALMPVPDKTPPAGAARETTRRSQGLHLNTGDARLLSRLVYVSLSLDALREQVESTTHLLGARVLAFPAHFSTVLSIKCPSGRRLHAPEQTPRGGGCRT